MAYKKVGDEHILVRIQKFPALKIFSEMWFNGTRDWKTLQAACGLGTPEDNQIAKTLRRQRVREYLQYLEEKRLKANLQNNSLAKFDIKKEDMVKELLEIIAKSKKGNKAIDRSNWLKAIEVINRMYGYNAPSEVEINSTELIFKFGMEVNGNDGE